MSIIKTGGLTAAVLGAAVFVAAPAAQAGDAGVNIIYPPKRAADFDKPDEPTRSGTREEVRVVVRVRPNYRSFWRERRRFYVERALYQNYLGFAKQYGGRDYPFD